MKFSYSKQIVLIFCCLISCVSFAQPGTSIDLENEKPEKYKEKLLNSEKTPDKKIKLLKRFGVNTVTHYNYYYNTGLKVEEIYETAKQAFNDDYSQLLPFYNYSLSTTATDKNIDSIIYKCNAGILLHDLRSDWVDDMYLFLGMAYYFRKDFDSAHHVFQYINYIYAPKPDGYDMPIGSNESNEEGIFTISNNEKKRKFLEKVFRNPTKRNDALIWLVRNYLAQQKTGEASGLLQMLQNDPYFPKRLKTDLHEVMSFNFYQQKQYDSAAIYLLKSLDNAYDRLERGRWEFLAGQLFQLSNMPEEANKAYSKSIKHTTNPLVELNAYLNMILGLQDSTTNVKSNATIDNVEMLKKLAKKERFHPYRDLIYYNIGKIEEAENNLEDAILSYSKSTKYSVDNNKQKSKSFLALADVEYKLKLYKPAYCHYDSVNITNIDKKSAARVNERKPALKTINDNIDAIYLQDSLQALAKLSPKELNDVLKKVYKKYLKEKGLKDDENNSFDFGSDNQATNNNSSFEISAKPGEFYFDNESIKLNGVREFKSKWGNRPNVDNWNRASAVALKFDDNNKQKEDAKKVATTKKKLNNITSKDKKSQNPSGDINAISLNPDNQDDENGIIDSRQFNDQNKEKETQEVTAESLFEAIPLDEEKLNKSNEIIIDALFSNGETFSNKLEDYPSAIEAYEELLRRFGKNKHKDQTIFNLSYCYQKAGKPNKLSKFNIDVNSLDINKLNSGNTEKDDATKKYAGIYNLFLEGSYEQAKKEKAEAEKIYGQKYWSSQLSFIESVYYIKQREDSIAIDRLNLIVKGNADKALQEKATLMIDVLKRRKEIEKHLSMLDSNGKYDSSLANNNAANSDSMLNTKVEEKVYEHFNDYKKDLSLVGKPFIFNPNEPHYAVCLLEKVDDVFLLETKKSFDRYNNANYSGNPPQVKIAKLNKDFTLVMLGTIINANDAISYMSTAKENTLKILPWLPKTKYTYTIIGISNVDILRVNDNLTEYKKFLKTNFPGKF